MIPKVTQPSLWEEEEIEQAQGRVYIGFIARWLFCDFGYPEFICEACSGTTSDIPNRAYPMKRVYRAPGERKRECCCACQQLF